MCKLRFSHQLIMLVPKRLLENAVFEACPERSRRATASRQDGKQELVRDGFPSRSLGTSGNRKIRHFGMDAEIQAMDGNKSVVLMLDSITVAKPSAISMLTANDGFMLVPKLLLGNAVFEAPASLQDGKQELVRDGFPSWSLGTSGNAVIPAGIAGIQIPGMAKFAEIATPTANDRFRKLTPSFLLFLLTL
ncbi:MAG: hypothetical protein DM484_26570, partial [Candidatus Methylumidiphilus alinenensis]